MTPDPKILYWTGALANFFAVVVFALLGVRRIRARAVRAHRRLMVTAASLVGLFLVSYLLKVSFLGREELGLWSSGRVAVLYLHETCILIMLLAGATAGYHAFRFRRSLPADPMLPPEDSARGRRRWHRRAGWTAVVASALAFVTAVFVLVGMYTAIPGTRDGSNQVARSLP